MKKFLRHLLLPIFGHTRVSDLYYSAKAEKSANDLMKRWEAAWGYHPLDEFARRAARAAENVKRDARVDPDDLRRPTTI